MIKGNIDSVAYTHKHQDAEENIALASGRRDYKNARRIKALEKIDMNSIIGTENDEFKRNARCIATDNKTKQNSISSMVFTAIIFYTISSAEKSDKRVLLKDLTIVKINCCLLLAAESFRLETYRSIREISYPVA